MGFGRGLSVSQWGVGILSSHGADRAKNPIENQASSFFSTRWAELVTAVSFLTRLPPALKADRPKLAQCVWAFPLAGALVGLAGALVAWLGVKVGLPDLASAFLAIGAMVVASGALHEDGLSDTADGMGAFTRERALEIMRDSRLGTYGALALLVIVGLRAGALMGLIASGHIWAPMIAAAAFGRAGCALMLGLLDPARKDGLGAASGRPTREALLVAVAIPVALAGLLFTGVTGLVAALVGGLPVFWLAWQAKRRLGGQTGDVVGAASLLAETTVLLVLAAGLRGGS